MELSLLREFIVLSQTLNYTKAAEILHLTQPTLSKHIVAMEKELGCSLLERDRRRVELTESGNVFAAAALQMVDTYDDAKQRIHDIQTLTPLKVNGIMSDSAIASINVSRRRGRGSCQLQQPERYELPGAIGGRRCRHLAGLCRTGQAR